MTRSRKNQIIVIIVASLVAYLFLIPLLFLVFTSFKGMSESIGSSRLLPINWTLDNYVNVMNDTVNSPMLRWIGNTTLITISATLIVMIVDSMAAFSLARLNLPGRKALVHIIIWIMTIPGIVTLFPSFYIFKQLSLTNTFVPLILPYSANAMGVFLIYNFLLSFPKALEEAAYVDGATTWTVFLRIVVPSLKPILMTLGLITFLAVYNDFLWPSLITTTNDMKTLTTGIASLIIGSNFVNPGLMMAATLLAVLPALILFLFLNKHLVRSELSAGIK